MRIVTYEDRAFDTIGLKLLLLSLRKHSPQVPVEVIFPSAPATFARWVSAFPNVSLHSGAGLKRAGYNVKPSVIAQALEDTSEVVWIDTDVIVTRDFQQLFARLPSQHLAVTEEWFGAPYQGGSYRSQAWGFSVGRQLKSTTNSAIVRATTDHRELLRAWDTLLEDENYINAQQEPWYKRLVHLQSDQEVLCALLESTKYAHIPIHYLKRGRDIAHCFQHQGYAAHQMIANLIGGNRPYFVHGQGAKPWRADDTFRYYLDVSTYTLCAAEYQAALEENTDWLLPTTRSAKIMRRIFRDNPWVTGLPLALYQEARNQRLLKTTIKQVLRKP